MTPEERRKLIEQPLPSMQRLFEDRHIGGKSHAGHCRITDAEADMVQKRYLRWLERRALADRYEG